MQRRGHRAKTSAVVLGEVIGLVSVVGVEVKPMATYFLRLVGVAGVVAESVVDAGSVPDWVRTWGPRLSVMCSIAMRSSPESANPLQTPRN